MPDNCLAVIPVLSGSALTNINLSRNMIADGIIEVSVAASDLIA